MKLRMGRRDILKKYIQRLEKLCEENRVLERVEELKLALLHHLEFSPDNNKGLLKIFNKLNTLDNVIVHYVILAENYARRPPPTETYKWSLPLQLLDKPSHTEN